VGEKIRRGLDQLDRGEAIPGGVARKKLQMMKARRRQPK
jgi:hypothetical protein